LEYLPLIVSHGEKTAAAEELLWDEHVMRTVVLSVGERKLLSPRVGPYRQAGLSHSGRCFARNRILVVAIAVLGEHVNFRAKGELLGGRFAAPRR
jgi:hypothetical protein